MGICGREKLTEVAQDSTFTCTVSLLGGTRELVSRFRAVFVRQGESTAIIFHSENHSFRRDVALQEISGQLNICKVGMTLNIVSDGVITYSKYLYYSSVINPNEHERCTVPTYREDDRT